MKAIVIGGGIGGIAAAGRLKREGFEVTLLEKNDHVGGRCDMINKDGHRFDTGPSLLLLPDAFEETFNFLGERLEDHLDLVRVDPAYRVYFGDAMAPLELSSNLVRMQEQLEKMEPGSFEKYLEYLKEGRINLHETLRHIAHRNFRNIFEYFNPIKIPILFKVKALKIHHSNIGNYFQNPKLKAAFTFQSMYIGLSPFEAPATFSLLQYTELCDGVWFPMGGMFQIIHALENVIKKLGVRVRCGAPVRKINVEAGGRKVTGVTLENGEVLEADVVVANADLPYVFKELLPDRKLAEGLMKLRFSSSTISFLWATDKIYHQLKHHNMFVSSDRFKESFDEIFYHHTLPEEPSFYINCPSRTDPSAAPAGCDSMMILVPVGHLSEKVNQNWPELIEKARKAVLRRLSQPDIGITDLHEHLKFEEIISPLDWRQRYNVVNGSTFGLNHQFTQVGYLRPQNKHPSLQNLYFAGCSTHPGSGLPNILVSSRLCVERILEDRKLHSKVVKLKPSGRFAPVPAKLARSSSSSLLFWAICIFLFALTFVVLNF